MCLYSMKNVLWVRVSLEKVFLVKYLENNTTNTVRIEFSMNFSTKLVFPELSIPYPCIISAFCS